MRRVLYVSADTPREIAVTEDGRLVEYIREDADGEGTESIYLGRVVRVMNSMQAAFVDIGQEKNGFLPLKEKSTSFDAQPLRDGARVAVQIKKEAHDSKGAFLTRDITLCGTYVLVMPCNRYIGVSARVAEADRGALKELGSGIADGRFGLVMRQAALTADEEQIRDEAERLYAEWQTVHTASATAHAPSLLYKPRTQLDSLLDDDRPRGIDEVVTEIPDLQIAGLKVTTVETGMMEREGLLRQRDKALERRVWLDCGGNLVIDPCEAMTVIDVNTAKNTGKRSLEDTLLKTDLEAAEEIARQVRLRNLSGVIIIDMIDLAEQEHRDMVLQALRKALENDRVKTVVHGMTSLGLIEMTRKKTGLPLRDVWTSRCDRCGGDGRIIKEDRHG